MNVILQGQGVKSFNGRTGIILPQQGDYTAEMIGALPTTGGNLSGDLTAQYITGTWLKSTANNHSSSTTTKICIQDNEGWIYYRTPSEIFNDIGVSNAIQSAIGNAIAANY